VAAAPRRAVENASTVRRTGHHGIPSAELKFVVTNTLIVGDSELSVAFYRDILGATVAEGEPTFLPARQYVADHQS
jgi:hypothetical protein